MSSQNDVFVDVHSLTCGYHGNPVVAGIDLKLKRGSVLAIMGPNGSGKSTFLDTLSGVLPAISGMVVVDERPVGSLSDKDRAKLIAHVPQEETPKFGFTVWQMVAMGRIARQEGLFESVADREAIQGALEEANATSISDRRFGELSGGERQRVLVARALAQGSELLLMDEPMAHLDLVHQRAMCRLISAEAKKGLTIVMALHDINHAIRVADRAIVINEGKPAISGTMDEVISSNELDEIFGVQFKRFVDDSNQVWLAPVGN